MASQHSPHLIHPSPQANAIGGSRSKTVREYLEKHYSDDKVSTDDGAIKLAITALLEVKNVKGGGGQGQSGPAY